MVGFQLWSFPGPADRAVMSATLLGVVVVASLATATSGLVPRVRLGAEPNPPVWPSSVRVFGPSDTDIEEAVNAA